MKSTFLFPLLVALALNSCGKDPTVVRSARDIRQVPQSIVSMHARSLPESDLPELARLPQVRHLSFTRGFARYPATISDDGLARLASLQLNLESLSLGFCDKITDAGLERVARINSLTALSVLGCSGITDAGLEPVVSMTNLTQLDLRGCGRVTDRGLDRLGAKTNWHVIILGGCESVTAEAVTRLRQKLPSAKIQKDDEECNRNYKAHDSK
jgi:hypothetical protein